MYKRKKMKKLLIPLLLLALGIGYALISTDLTINGITKYTHQTWDVHFENLVPSEGNVTLSTDDVAASIDPSSNTEISFTVTLQKPKDFYEFTVDVVNEGSMDAMINLITTNLNGNPISAENAVPNYANFIATYSDGVTIVKNHLLKGENGVETFKVRLEYSSDINSGDLPETVQSLTFTFGVEYVQADSNAIERSLGTFSTDSWETIISNLETGITYELGSTKEVELGNNLGTHTLRVANTSTPKLCSEAGFSQTACGIVLEFADIITNYNMNSTSTTDSGWTLSEMRTRLNDVEDSTSIINSLPEVLKNAIIDTNVVSEYGPTSGRVATLSTDKLFLLEAKEIWGGNAAYNQTRQLDYYANIGATQYINYNRVAKQYNGTNSEWWLRRISSTNMYSYVTSSGDSSYKDSATSIGVSPAFRLKGPSSLNLVTVTVDNQNGNSVKSFVLAEGERFTLPTPDANCGYRFNGWYTESSGGTKVGITGEIYKALSNATLYAQWTESDFSNDSWSTIVSNIQSGNASRYRVGDDKEITLNNDLGTHCVRLSNTSTPAECGAAGFSETACGFVIEFEDIITTHNMNSTDTNVGGWPASELRTYLNDTNDSSSIINSLPVELKNLIIDTTVVSGYGCVSGMNNRWECSNPDNNGKNFTSTDKLYLLSTHELWKDTLGGDNLERYDTAYNNTRQLDYYANLRVAPNDKRYNINNRDISWWLRTAGFYGNYSFFFVSFGRPYNTRPSNLTGVSPAFRIG